MSYDLIDDAIWERLAPLIPARRRRRGHRHGRTPIPDRAILTGILFVLRPGIPRQMLPRRTGCGSGVHQAFLTLGCVLICWNYLKAPKRVF